MDTITVISRGACRKAIAYDPNFTWIASALQLSCKPRSAGEAGEAFEFRIPHSLISSQHVEEWYTIQFPTTIVLVALDSYFDVAMH